MPITLRFESTLAGTPSEVWQWVASPEGIRGEMLPWLHLSMPPGVRRLEDLDIRYGEPLFASRMRFLGVLPLGTFHPTFLELSPDDGFIEESPITWMKRWRHERRLRPSPDGVILTDELTLVPLFGAPLVRRFVEAFFAHRHRRLRRQFPVR